MQVRDGIERIVNLMGNAGCEASGDGQFFACNQSGFGSLLIGYIAEDQNDAD